ncbi:Aldehyde/histidinol dehydrogenase [Fimicolochytrium jonesii]|uniref:Aldehyde/histidinol dehydrogenase n=1 Tax=Fimicolochytrium jonesii TaxID=1396493 RepID=UPI0022FEC268|nr:Aldehyde/histidinol dehydrogenase [Fimicolochytrium jonesii]KAI8816166.1 Aldehyde/histidinol dehydrogenase [Fimicolochytrium jonesii]
MADHTILSPANSKPYLTRPLASSKEALAAVHRAATAFPTWRTTPLDTRIALIEKFVTAFVAKKDVLVEELAWLMGRPIKQNANEVRGFEERARHMISIAKDALKDVPAVPEKEGLKRFVRREPLGVVFVIAAWNYPYLISVNGVVPALLAGNTVILKQAPQTFPCAERFAEAFKEAGLPDGVFQYLHIDHPTSAQIISHPQIAHVLFTGSVRGGHEVCKTAAERFVGVGLELGGKDAAYVREDADIAYAAENLVDGAMYNSGQSCCGIERIYVHEKVHDQLVERMVEVAKGYKLGDPLHPDTNLGPVVSTKAADFIREQIEDAVSKGANPHLLPTLFPAAQPSTPYVAPQILTNVSHSMRVMTEETFGPVVGIMRVSSDDEAVRLINDSVFGLTASVWTRDEEAALKVADGVEVGTVFMNRCDYLDPALPWTAVKESGRGVTLSVLGYDHLTRPKSFHFRVKT